MQRLVHTGSLLRLLPVRVLSVLTLADGDIVWLVVLVGPTASEATLTHLPLHLIDECDLVGADHHWLLLCGNGRPIDRAESGRLHCLPLRVVPGRDNSAYLATSLNDCCLAGLLEYLEWAHFRALLDLLIDQSRHSFNLLTVALECRIRLQKCFLDCLYSGSLIHAVFLRS